MSKMGFKLTTSSSIYSNHSKNSYSIDDKMGLFHTLSNNNSKLKQSTDIRGSAIRLKTNSNIWRRNIISINSSSLNSKLSLNSSAIQYTNKNKGKNKEKENDYMSLNKKKNNSIEVSQRVKTISIENKERVLQMKREKEKRQQEQYESTQQKKQLRNQTARSSREKVQNEITERLCMSKKSRFETETAIQVNKRKKYKVIKGLHDDIHDYRVNNELRNRKELIAQKNKIKQILLERIMQEEKLKEHYQNQINEFNKIMVNRIKDLGLNNEKFEVK